MNVNTLFGRGPLLAARWSALDAQFKKDAGLPDEPKPTATLPLTPLRNEER